MRSIRVARQPGIKQAQTATASMKIGTAAKVSTIPPTRVGLQRQFQPDEWKLETQGSAWGFEVVGEVEVDRRGCFLWAPLDMCHAGVSICETLRSLKPS
jgi:hypothetical protein